jgi:hypothetical protein
MDGRVHADAVEMPRLAENRQRTRRDEQEVQFRFAGGYLEQVEECAEGGRSSGSMARIDCRC